MAEDDDDLPPGFAATEKPAGQSSLGTSAADADRLAADLQQGVKVWYDSWK